MSASNTRSRFHAARYLALLLVAGCGPGDATVVETPVPTTVTILPTPVTMTFLGQSVGLTARVLDQNGNVVAGSDVSWLSDNPGVATVSTSGLVEAVANGAATVTAASGALTATVAVTVDQVPTAVLVASGNNQQTVAATALADPVVVRVVDGGGQPIENVTVTFTPNAGHGSVSATSAVSDANGEASTMWTLGTFFGPMVLVASTAGLSTEIDARAFSEFPTPDIAVIAPLSITRDDPTTLESFTVSTTVRNDGDLTTGGASSMRLLADGADIGSVVIPELAPDAEAAVEFTAGPLAVGTYDVSFVADPDDAILELDETNNSADGSVVVVTQAVVSVGANMPITGTTGDELLFRLTMPGPPVNLTIELTGGSGDADLFIDAGNRPSDRQQYAGCISAGPTSAERCQIGNASGTYHIQVHAFETFAGTNMTITTGDALLPYDIDIVFLDNGTPAQDQAFLDMAARWSSIISADVPDIDFSTQPVDADQCIEGQPQITGMVDDVRIYVKIIPIDGPLGTLAQAGPCVTRGLSNLPIVGSVQFDEADLERLDGDNDMDEVILHEMGHVLGFGTLWGPQWRDLLVNPSLPSNQGADTHFSGPNAIAAFDAAGGSSYSSAKVPVENQAGEGSGDAHWRESVLDLELMTPFLDGLQFNALSAISVQSLKDLGYSVDVTQADNFSFTPPAMMRARAEGTGGGVLRRIIDLRGDIRTGPIYRVSEKGEIVEIRR